MQTGMENCLRMDIINCIAKTNLWIRSMWRVMCKSVGCPSMNCVLATPPVSTCPTAFVSFYPSFRAITNIHWQQSRHQAPHCSKENFSQVRYSQYQFICGNKIFVVSNIFPQRNVGLSEQCGCCLQEHNGTLPQDKLVKSLNIITLLRYSQSYLFRLTQNIVGSKYS